MALLQLPVVDLLRVALFQLPVDLPLHFLQLLLDRLRRHGVGVGERGQRAWRLRGGRQLEEAPNVGWRPRRFGDGVQSCLLWRPRVLLTSERRCSPFHLLVPTAADDGGANRASKTRRAPLLTASGMQPAASTTTSAVSSTTSTVAVSLTREHVHSPALHPRENG